MDCVCFNKKVCNHVIVHHSSNHTTLKMSQTWWLWMRLLLIDSFHCSMMTLLWIPVVDLNGVFAELYDVCTPIAPWWRCSDGWSSSESLLRFLTFSSLHLWDKKKFNSENVSLNGKQRSNSNNGSYLVNPSPKFKFSQFWKENSLCLYEYGLFWMLILCLFVCISIFIKPTLYNLWIYICGGKLLIFLTLSQELMSQCISNHEQKCDSSMILTYLSASQLYLRSIYKHISWHPFFFVDVTAVPLLPARGKWSWWQCRQ